MLSLDTNVLVYAEGIGDLARVERAEALLASVSGVKLVIAVQVLGELFRVLRVKGRLPTPELRRRLARYRRLAVLAPTLETTWTDAIALATDHGFQIFEAVILAASAEAGCRLLLSEEMQDGFVWRGVTVANPFATEPQPMLADFLRG